MKKSHIAIIVFGCFLAIALCSFSAYRIHAKNNIPKTTDENITEEYIESELTVLQETTEEIATQAETTTEKRVIKSQKITALKDKLNVDKELPAAPVTTPPTLPSQKPDRKPSKPSKPNNKPTQKPVQKIGIIVDVPSVLQYPKYPMGCEAASATCLMKYYKITVTMDEMINAIPREDLYEENGKVYGPDISIKFAGNPKHKASDDNPGFGAYSPVVYKAMNSVLAQKHAPCRAKNITGCPFNTLIKSLDNKNPVIVWSTYKMKPAGFKDAWLVKNPDGTESMFKYPTLMHIMVLHGYDKDNIYLMDPILGFVKYPKKTFENRWIELGKQAIVMEKGIPLPPIPDITMPSTDPSTVLPSLPSTLPSTNPSTIPSTSPSTKPSTEASTSAKDETTSEVLSEIESHIVQ